MRRRICALLTALCLLWALPPAAEAQGGPSLLCGDSDGGVSLTLEGLEETVYALQLELVLQGVCPDAAFVSAVPGAYAPDCRVEIRGNETAVTVYMTAPEGALASGDTLYLGTLETGRDFTLPAQGELLLLDRSLQPCRSSGAVRLESRQDPAWGGGQLPGQTPSGGSGTDRPSTGGGTDRPSSGGLPEPVVPPQIPLPFLDVPEGYWCRAEVDYIYRLGLMNGTSATTFSPTGTTTRGMIVTILYRMEGSPAAGLSVFSDVSAGAYYADAVAWASSHGIVNGYEDGSFRPDAPITREQMAAFLFRYARYKGQDVSLLADLSGFADAGQISDYAVEALRWANARGLITGTSASAISPAGNATREQAAVILARFLRGSGTV